MASRLAQANGHPMPSGEPVASFVRHDDALSAFDVLSEQQFPVTALYLVNDGIRQVEYPVQTGYGRALLVSAIQGVMIGLLYSLFVAAGGTNFMTAALSTVPISVAIFVLWRVFDLRPWGALPHAHRGDSLPHRAVRSAGVRSGCAARAGCAPSLLGSGCGRACGDCPGSFAGACRSEHRLDEWRAGSDRCPEGAVLSFAGW